ncbi:hypothetical protein JJQ72_15360 [Paenibacillus sp. F411]|uniref:Uncharacterized protein n=1 Tax=Paenibacillus algicola TaxID=2565926 RepID=A0A4P8XIY5_9BACL|nr:MULTISPECIES: hypothetical protein [Paenibacillus]MBO2945353.1 hypothetical protein [Paenibacillus sp. F411]QCT01291.1 hypothetical protein E6C60_0568 [Paenibacillus algicola]
MATFTTSLITNTRATGTAATNLIVNSRNLGSSSASIVVVVFGVPESTLILTPLYVTGFTLPANSANIRQFFIAGNVSYEVQYSITSPFSQVVMSSYGIDEFGNLVTDQRVLQSELTPTNSLSIPV